MQYNHTYFNFSQKKEQGKEEGTIKEASHIFFHPEEYETERGNGYVMELVLLKVGT